MSFDQSRTLRHGGVLGLAGNLVMMASLPLAPKWPPSSAGNDVVVAYFRDNHDGFLRQAWVAGLGVVILIGLAGALAELARARGAHVVASLLFGGMLAFVGAFAINWTPWIAIAHRPHEPDVVRALYDFGLLGQFTGVGAALALFFGALAWASLVERIVPRAFGAAALVAVPLNIALAKATDVDGALSPSGSIGMASLGLFGLLLTSLSIWMIVASRRSPATT